MAEFDITSPDGKVFRVTAPENASQQDIISYAQKQIPSAQSVIQGIRENRVPQPEDKLDPASNIGMGALKTVANIGSTLLYPVDKALNAAGLTTTTPQDRRSEVNQFFDQYADTGKVPFKLGQFGGGFLGTVGAGRLLGKGATLAGLPKVGNALETAGMGIQSSEGVLPTIGNAATRIGAGGVTGAAMGGLENPEHAASGGLIGMVFGAASPLVKGALESQVQKRVISLPELQQQADQIAEKAISRIAKENNIPIGSIQQDQVTHIRAAILDSLKAGKEITDPSALVRKSDFASLGMNPLQGQITRDPTQFARERNLRGVSPEIQNTLMGQNRTLQSVYGEPAMGADTAYSSGNKLIESLRSKDESLRQNVSGLYKAARESTGKDLDVPLQGFAQDYATIIKNFGDKVPSGVRNNIDELGIMTGKQSKIFTLEDADSLSKVINANRSSDPAVNAALDSIKISLRKAVESAAPGGGPFAPAVKAAAERFKLHDDIPALKAVADNDAIPDKFVQKYVINGNTDQVKKLADVLRKESPEVFDQTKSQFADEIKRAAFGENVTADSVIRPEMIAKALRQFGPEKMGAFFTPQEIARYQAASRVANYIEKHPNAAPVNTSNSTVMALMENPVTRTVLSNVPGADVAVNAAKAVTGGVKTQREIATAIEAKIPTKKLDLTPDQRKLLSRALSSSLSSAIQLNNYGRSK